jgi:hypothetical protein
MNEERTYFRTFMMTGLNLKTLKKMIDTRVIEKFIRVLMNNYTDCFLY